MRLLLVPPLVRPLVPSFVPVLLVALVLPGCRLWGIGLPCDGDEDCPPAQTCRGVCVDDGAPAKDDAGPGPDAGVDVGEWHAASLAFAVDVEVTVTVRATDLPIVVDLDPQGLLRANAGVDAGADVVLEEASLRVYEGATELPSMFLGGDGFGEEGGLLAFALPGVSEPGTRAVRVYFTAQGDEPGVVPPAYWRDEVRENVAAAGLELVGLNVDGVGIVRKMQVGDSLFFMNHTTRFLADGPDAGQGVSGGGYPAATDVLYEEPFGPPQVRLDEPSLVLVESVGDAVTATGAVVRVRELLLAGPRPLALSVVRVDNLTGGPLSSARLFAYLDPDVADANDDDAAVTGNTLLVTDASPARILVAHDGAATALRTGLIHEMAPALQDGVVAGGSSATALDVGVCVEWTLGALAPGAHATARHVFGLDPVGAASLEEARDELLSPATTVGPLLRRPD